MHAPTYRLHRLVAACALATGAAAVSAQPILEEVIVTAQKREQSLQDAPIAITAFGAEDIETRGIRDVQDIGLFVPNVQIAPSPGGSTGAIIAIRGSTTVILPFSETVIRRI